MATTPTPHDALFRASFRRPEIARSELELVLPPAVRDALDLTSLTVLPGSFVDDELRQTHCDLLYGVRTVSGDPAIVCVLAEAQAKFDPLMPFRLLEYAVRVWRRWLDDHKGSKIPLLVCVVLHHGEDPWKARPELASMFEASPEAIEATRALTPHFAFVLDDLRALSLDALAHRTLHVLGRLVQLALWTGRSAERFEAAAPLMKELAATTTRDANTRSLLVQLYAYLLQVVREDAAPGPSVYTRILEIAGPEGKEDVVTAAEKLINQGRAEGEARGRAKAVLAVLQARGLTVSDSLRERVLGCSDVALLETWLVRAMTVPTADALFVV